MTEKVIAVPSPNKRGIIDFYYEKEFEKLVGAYYHSALRSGVKDSVPISRFTEQVKNLDEITQKLLDAL